MREYAVVLLTAAVVTFLATPVVRMAAVRLRMMAAPRERDVHIIPTPRGGGVAMYLGIAAAVLVASKLPALQRTFEDSQTYAVLVAGGLICLLGVLDDKWGLDALTKLTGQIAAAGVLVLLGVQLAFLFLPVADIGTISLGPQVGVPLTILLTVLTVNALNFIDGLDGLAAGVSAIAALALFAYSYNLGQVGYDDVASAPALVTAVLAGACLGFLPHNFSPARIFMGDSGSMLVGLMLSAAVVSATGGVDPQTFDSAATLLPLTLPLLVPVAILFIPFVDLVLAVIRRTRRGQSPFSPDKMHLHHRLLSIGHSHRRAVLVMYFWAGLLSFGAVALSITGGRAELLVAVAVLLVVGVVVVLSPRARRAAREARAAELVAQRQRSRADHPSARARDPAAEHTGSRPMTARPARPVPSDVPWDLSFLRVGATIVLAVAAVAAAVTGLLAGWADAAGVLLGAVVVTLFFCISGVVVAWAGRIDDAFTLPAALGSFLVKAIVLFAILSALPEDGWLDRLTFAWSVIIGALAWSGIQLRWVWTRQLYYVRPPDPPGRPADVRPDPEKPASRG